MPIRPLCPTALPGQPPRPSPTPPGEPGPLAGAVAAGVLLYDRRRMLPRLLPVGPGDLVADDAAGLRRICARLARALRSERARGRAGHWSYDLNRHIGLLQAFRAERLRLHRTEALATTKRNPDAVTTRAPMATPETATGCGPSGHAPRPSLLAAAGA